MDLEQFIRDTIELAVYLRQHLSKPKIILVGHSWGAALGLQVAKRRPDLFYAFVGTGQPVSNELGLLSQERYARTVLIENKDAAGLKALDEAAQLPFTDPKRRFATRKLLFGSEDRTFLAKEDSFMGPKPRDPKPIRPPLHSAEGRALCCLAVEFVELINTLSTLRPDQDNRFLMNSISFRISVCRSPAP